MFRLPPIAFLLPALALTVPAGAVDRLPARVDFVGHLPSVSRLKLDQAVEALPGRKEEARQKLKSLVSSLGLKSIEDFKEIWLLVDKGSTRSENRSLIVATVDVTLARIKETLQGVKLPVKEDTVAGQSLIVLPRGRAAICVPEKSRLLLGDPELMAEFLTLKPKDKGDHLGRPSVAGLFAALDPAAFVQLVATRHEPAPEPWWKFGKDRRGPMAQKLREYVTEGTEFDCGVVQLFDDRLTLEVLYLRDKKPEKVRGEFTISDKRIRISALIDLIIHELPAVE